MPTYKVKTPVRKDGTDFAPGETIELSVKEAKAIGTDVVERIPEATKAAGNGNGSGEQK
jgi:hypothetical protein